MILACDIGSSYTKVALLRNPMEQEAQRQNNVPVIYSSYRKYLPLEQQNGASWKELLCDIATVLQRSKFWEQDLKRAGSITGKESVVRLEALSFSSHGPSLLAIDRDGQAIQSNGNPMHRMSPEIQQFRRGSSFYLPLARALWAQLNEEQRRQVAWILPPANYVCSLLTGRTAVPIPEHYYVFYWPSSSQVLQASHTFQTGSPNGRKATRERHSWQDNHELDSQFLHLLPPLVPFSDKIGDVQLEALNSYGFIPKIFASQGIQDSQALENRQGLPVFCPGVDFFAAEAGLSHSCDTMLRNRTGTSEGFNLFLPENGLTTKESQQRLEAVKFPPGYFLNYHIISKRPLLSYVQEGTGLLFGQLFELWQNSLNAKRLGDKGVPNLLATGNGLECASFQRSQENIMLQSIMLNSSASELQRANKFAKAYIHSDRPITEFFPFLELELGQKLENTSFERVGLHSIQLLVQYFILRSQTMFEMYQQFIASPLLHQKQVLLSGGQAYYPNWLHWKAEQSNMTIHTPSICDAEFIGAAAICYYNLGYFCSIDIASKYLLEISRTYN